MIKNMKTIKSSEKVENFSPENIVDPIPLFDRLRHKEMSFLLQTEVFSLLS